MRKWTAWRRRLVCVVLAFGTGCGGGNRTMEDRDAGGGGVDFPADLPATSRGTMLVPDEEPANWGCLGSATEPARGADIDVTMNLVYFGEGGPARNVRVWFFPDNVVRDSCEPGLCQEQTTSTDDGTATFRTQANGWYAYRVFARMGPTSATTVVDSLQYNEPAPASPGTIEGNAVPRSTTDLIPAVLGFPRAAGTALMAGKVLDCDQRDVYGAVVRFYAPDGSVIQEGPRQEDPHLPRYFNGDNVPDGFAQWTHADGLYAAVNVPVPSDPTARIRVEAWGRTEEGAAPVRLGCEAIRVFADAVSIVNIGPLRNDYPEGHPCADGSGGGRY